MSERRNFNEELQDASDHKYAYTFDLDVMHPFMIRAFQPFFKKGNLLELGSFRGDFTRRLIPLFDDITCVEASDQAVASARTAFGDKVRLFTGHSRRSIYPVDTTILF